MMISETKILFDNIKKIRLLLTEEVSDSLLIDAINNHKYLYIYYDSNDPKSATGWRTIRPVRLGLLKSKTDNNGQLVLRAWQDAGDSYSFKNPRKGAGHKHDVFTDNNGKIKPGWRLFFVHNIVRALPTGKRFVDNDGKVLIPPLYKETDMFIPIEVAKIGKTTQLVKTKGLGSIVEPDVITIDTKKVSKNLTKKIIEGLYHYVVYIRKEKASDFNVTVDDKGNFNVRRTTMIQLPANEKIVGNLVDLKNKFLGVPEKEIKKKADDFIKNQKNMLTQNVVVQEIKNNIKTIPVERKTFFK